MDLSHNTRRALDQDRPRLRGVVHRWAAIVAVPVGIASTVAATPGLHRLAVAMYAAGSVVMLAVSAGMHQRDRGARGTELWVRLDHSAIYVMIATSISAIGLLVLPTAWVWWVVGLSWLLAVVGLAVEWVPRRTPRGFAHTMFLVNGWSTVVLVGWMWSHPGAGPVAVAWLLAGGVAYTVGAVVVAARRPDPAPGLFGYHEVWHVLVVVAVACHWWLVGGVLG